MVDHCCQEFYPPDDYSHPLWEYYWWKQSARFQQLVIFSFVYKVGPCWVIMARASTSCGRYNYSYLFPSLFVSTFLFALSCIYTFYTSLFCRWGVLYSDRGKYLYCANCILETNMKQFFLPVPPHTCRQGCQQAVLPLTMRFAADN